MHDNGAIIMFDFSPIRNNEKKILEQVDGVTVQHLRDYTNESVDFLLSIIADLDDADVIFAPVDPNANDPYAVAGEENIGWNIAHLLVHVTASSEEWATYASILARGIVYPAEPRLRYETSWHDVTTKAQCIQRLEESRRIRLGYLDAMPDTPFLEIKRELSPRYVERFGEMNAVAAFLFGLMHETGHYEQLEDAKRQALAAKEQGVQSQ
jgi:hypothetical protein